MREAVFSSLAPWLEGAAVVDLFAGSGAYGLEALSRGAKTAVFVESHRRALRALGENCRAVCKSLGCAEEVAEIVPVDVFQLNPGSPRADIVFCDPPYPIIGKRAEAIFAVARALLHPQGRLVFEMPGELDLGAEGFTLQRRLGGRKRGDPTVLVYERI